MEELLKHKLKTYQICWEIISSGEGGKRKDILGKKFIIFKILGVGKNMKWKGTLFTPKKLIKEMFP